MLNLTKKGSCMNRMIQAVRREGGGARPSRGVTLIELLVTIAVLAVLAALASPSFTGLVNGNRITSATNDALAAIQSARMEAIRRNSRVTVCPSQNGTGCGGGDWSRFIVGVPATDGSITEVLQDIAIPGRIRISSPGDLGNRFTFRADGFARAGQGASPTFVSGALQVCMATNRPNLNARTININGSRVHVATPVRVENCT